MIKIKKNTIENKVNDNLNGQILNNDFINKKTNKNNEQTLDKNNIEELNIRSSNKDNLIKDEKNNPNDNDIIIYFK